MLRKKLGHEDPIVVLRQPLYSRRRLIENAETHRAMLDAARQTHARLTGSRASPSQADAWITAAGHWPVDGWPERPATWV